MVSKIVGISDQNTGAAGVLGMMLERAIAGEFDHVVVAVVTKKGEFDYTSSPLSEFEFLGMVGALQARAHFEAVMDALEAAGADGRADT